MKRCKQCGIVRPPQLYRKYYNRKGYYKICKHCESINSRARYLEKKDSLTDKEQRDLDTIYALWDKQCELGYGPTRRRAAQETNVMDKVHEMLDISSKSMTGPPELTKWLTEELTEEPDYYLDEVYENLKKTYRPVLGIDEETHLPLHDDTYANILDKILGRFFEYDDDWHEKNY